MSSKKIIKVTRTVTITSETVWPDYYGSLTLQEAVNLEQGKDEEDPGYPGLCVIEALSWDKPDSLVSEVVVSDAE